MSTVLIVDDYPGVRKGLRSLLEKFCSVVCIEASNGLDAIAKAEVSRPDLIILDLGMPGMNGFDAATVLQKTMPQVPLFMCSPEPRCRIKSDIGGNTRCIFQVYGYQRICGTSKGIIKSLSRPDER